MGGGGMGGGGSMGMNKVRFVKLEVTCLHLGCAAVHMLWFQSLNNNKMLTVLLCLCFLCIYLQP